MIIINELKNYFSNPIIIKFIIATVYFYCLDFLTGFARAWRNKDIKSGKLRDGVVKAIQYFAFLSIGVIIDFLTNKDIALVSFSIMVCGIELKSLTENFKEMELSIPDWVLKFFEVNEEDSE